MKSVHKDKLPKKTPELFPGHGGYLQFTEDGAYLFIPRSFLEAWPSVELKVSRKNDRITISKAERLSEDSE